MADGKAFPWRMMWLGAALALVVLAGAPPAWTLAQDEGGGDGSGQAAGADEPAAPDEAAAADDDDGEEDANGDAVEITTVTKTEVVSSTDVVESETGGSKEKHTTEKYTRTVTTGTLPAGGAGGAAGGGGDGDPYSVLLGMYDRAGGQLLRTPEEEDLVDFSDFVTEGVELYYYPDVKRLMQILNPRAYEVDGVQGARDRLLKARAALEQARRDVAEKERAVSAALATSAGAQSLLDAALEVVFSLQTQITGKEDLLEALTEQLAELVEKQTSSPDDEDLAESVKEKEAAIKEVTEALEGEEGEGGLRKQLSDAEAKVASDSELSKGVSDAAAKLAEARREMHQKQDLVKAYAEVENMAFAYARDNAPFWVAPALAHEPECECVLGYDVEDALGAYAKKLEEWQKQKDKLTAAIKTLAEQSALFRAAEQAEAKASEDYEFALKLYEDSSKCKQQQAALAKAKQALDAARLKVDEAQAACEEATAGEKTARAALDKAKAQLAQAQASVGKAHDCEVSRERYKDTDPVNLVFMFAFPERALIILRGKIDHIRQAKRVIREYDVPAPMARVTLWSLEMNSDATPKGTKHLNAALAAIDEEFALTRAQIDATLSILRDAVNEEVTTRAEAAYAGEVGRPPFGATSLEGYLDDTMSCLAMRDPTFKRYFAYPSIVRTSLGFNTDYPLYGEYLLREWASDVERGVLIDSADGYREWTESIDNGNWHEQWEPRTRDNSTLSDSPWLQEALPREDAWTSEGQASFTRAQLRASLEEYYGLMSTVIPDPVAVNTVGEAMLMLNLLDTESRARILRQFETKLNAYLRENCMWRASGHWCGDETGCCNDAPLSFHRLVRALGIDEYSGQSGAGGLAGKQIAVIQAIKRYHIRRLMGAAGGLILAADRQEVEYRQLFNLWIARELENSSAADVSEFMGKPDKNRDDPRVFKLPVTQDIMTTISTGLKRKLREMVDVGDIPPMYVGYLDACIDNLVGSRTQLSGGTVPADSAQRYVPVEHWELYNAKRLFSYMSQDELADAIVKRMWLNRKTLEAARPVQYWVVNELRADPDVLSDVLERSFNAEREAWWRDDNWDKRGTAEQFDHDCYILREILDQVYEQYVGDNPYRQVAKGDELLKELNKAMEDELDTHFVQPMLQRLRQRLLGTGVSVGALQRTSMLVTNRKRSRIEPLASAQLRMGEDVSLLPELQLLDDIYQIAQQGNVRDVLDVLAKLEGEDDTTEVYGVTSGNRFVVTPVFDPTGQAYRFTFDHLYTNRIRDPDGTTSQGTLNLPRTERLSLNTDVQLSNFEIREVARFESNARLGIAPSESGGIPVLRHVPLLRELPLIGWFKRRTGKAAIVQQTVIFAQTTMYPTIDEIVPLMTSSILVVGDRQN